MKLVLSWLILLGFGLAWTPERVQASVVSTSTSFHFSFSKVTEIVLLGQAAGGSGSGGGMEKIKQALYTGSGAEGGGVLDVGLGWLRGIVIFFLGIYGVYLGVSIAFGQGEPGLIANFFFGSMMALGAQAVAGLYSFLFEKGGGGK